MFFTCAQVHGDDAASIDGHPRKVYEDRKNAYSNEEKCKRERAVIFIVIG